MRFLSATILFVFLALLMGCSSDDDNGGNGGSTPTVEVNTTVSAPSMTDANDPVWDEVEATEVPIEAGIAPPAAAKPFADFHTLWVQGIKTGGTLYLRVQWNDDSLHLDRDAWQLSSAENFAFNHWKDISNQLYKEDQFYLLFSGLDTNLWDAWNWRVLTTGQAWRAEDMTWDGETLVSDGGSSQGAWENSPSGAGGERPSFVHEDEWLFTESIMYYEDKVDVTTGGVIARRLNWTNGQLVPGWMVDTTLRAMSLTSESRWNVQATYEYDAENELFTVVLARVLSTGEADDIDLSSLSEVTVQAGVLDDVRDITIGSSRRGFTDEFIIKLQ